MIEINSRKPSRSVGAWHHACTSGVVVFYPLRIDVLLAETRLADREDAVPDEVWSEAARHSDDQALGTLVLHIGMVNLHNRLDVTTKQVPGAEKW